MLSVEKKSIPGHELPALRFVFLNLTPGRPPNAIMIPKVLKQHLEGGKVQGPSYEIPTVVVPAGITRPLSLRYYSSTISAAVSKLYVFTNLCGVRFSLL